MQVSLPAARTCSRFSSVHANFYHFMTINELNHQVVPVCSVNTLIKSLKFGNLHFLQVSAPARNLYVCFASRAMNNTGSISAMLLILFCHHQQKKIVVTIVTDGSFCLGCRPMPKPNAFMSGPTM